MNMSKVCADIIEQLSEDVKFMFSSNPSKGEEFYRDLVCYVHETGNKLLPEHFRGKCEFLLGILEDEFYVGWRPLKVEYVPIIKPLPDFSKLIYQKHGVAVLYNK